MDNLHTLYYFLDLTGTFAFAISGATAARQKGLDLFGICVVAFTVACGGGIIRDLCIGAIPPAGISNWRYLVTALIAAAATIGLYSFVQRLNRPVRFFDSLGLAIFAVTGAQKSLAFGHNAEVAILLGIITAVGGGVLRDVILNRIPVIFEKEIYGSAALLGAALVTLGHFQETISHDWVTIIALLVCLVLRLLAVRFHWNLPVYSIKESKQE